MKPINIRLIRKVLKWIEADLRRLDMRDYAYTREYAGESRGKYAECGTKACMAGWTVLLQYPKKQWKERATPMYRENMHRKAKDLLGLSVIEADLIFTGNGVAPDTAKKQLKALKGDINAVLEARGMKERV